MPVLPYRLRLILQTIFRRSRIFHCRQRQQQQRTPTPSTPVIDQHVTQFINEYVTPFVDSVTEHTSVDSIQRVRAALIQVNDEYIACEQEEIDNLRRIIQEAQDILEIEAGEIDEDGTSAFYTAVGTLHADAPFSDTPTYATDDPHFPEPFPETEINPEIQVDHPKGSPFIRSLVDSYVGALYIRPQFARDLYGLYGETTIPGTVYSVGDLVAIASNERCTIPLLEDWDPVDTTSPPHCAHIGEHCPPSTASYYPPMQVEVHTELEFFRVNADLWQAPLTEEEEAALIAQEAADNEAAELEEFRQARIHADAFDEAEELQQRREEFEAAREAAFLLEQQEQEQIEDALLYPLRLEEVELELEYTTKNDPNFPTADNDSWDSEDYRFAPVTHDQCLVARQYFYRNPENEALVASPSPSISNHSSYYEPSEHLSDVPVVWLFDQLPYTSYHSEDNSAASSVPSLPAPSASSIQSSVN